MVQKIKGYLSCNYFNFNYLYSLNYHPFGMVMPGRNYSSDKYRFGFNGKEKDDEVKGLGNSLDFGARIYDSRICRWLSVDGLESAYPNNSPYIFVRDNPILRIDPDGNTDYTATVALSKDPKTSVIKKVVDVQIVYQVLDLSSGNSLSTGNVIAGHNTSKFDVNFLDKDQSGNVVDVEVHVNVSFEIINHVDQISNDKNVMFIVDDIGSQPTDYIKSDPVGRATMGGQQAAVEKSEIYGGSTVMHELGHNLGLKFENNPNDPGHSKDKDHLMFGAGQGARLEDSDLKKVYNSFRFLNDGKYEMGAGKAKSTSIDFLKNNNLRYDKDKASKAGIK